MNLKVYNPVEILMQTDEHPEETIRVGRLVDLTGRQFRFVISGQSLEPGNRYDVDPILVNQNTLWIEQAWEFMVVQFQHDW